MSPRVRRALHEALDHVLDAIAADAAPTNPRSKKRPILLDDTKVSPEASAKADAALRKAGLL